MQTFGQLKTGTFLQAAQTAIQKALSDPATKPFSFKITNKIAPGYNKVVEHPMDLTKILHSLSKGAYKRLEEVDKDVQQVRITLPTPTPLPQGISGSGMGSGSTRIVSLLHYWKTKE